MIPLLAVLALLGAGLEGLVLEMPDRADLFRDGAHAGKIGPGTF